MIHNEDVAYKWSEIDWWDMRYNYKQFIAFSLIYYTQVNLYIYASLI